MKKKLVKKSWRLLNKMVAIFMILPFNALSLLPLSASATVATYSIIIEDPLPINFSCPQDPTENPLIISGSGLGAAPPGLTSQYAVQVDWGDGTVEDNLGNFSYTSDHGPFSFTFSAGPHTYVASGSYTVTVKLYHQSPAGNDGKAEDSLNIEICTEEILNPSCGDGDIEGDETCDDGDEIDGNGCSANCTLENLTCEELDGNGWFGRYYNYLASHPDMDMQGSQWGEIYGDPLGTWGTDWYDSQYFEFSRIDGDITFGEDFFPFDMAPEEDNYNGHDFHFGVRWSGIASVETEGDYNYTLTSDDDAWLYLDGVLMVDNSGIHAPITKTGSLHLTGHNVIDIFFAERHANQSHFSFNLIGEGITIDPYSEECSECGNYIVEGREECDEGPSGLFSCSPDCQMAPVCDPEVELILNGSFENPTVTNTAMWDIFSSELTGWITDWVSFDTYPGQTRPATATLELQKSGLFSEIIPDGNQYAELDGDWAGPNGAGDGEPASVKISQELETWPGYEYQVTFNFSPRPSLGASDNVLEFSWDGILKDTITRSGISEFDWSSHSYDLTASGYETLIEFADAGISNSLGTFVDNISVRCIPTPTPEPEVKICKQDIEQNYLPGWQVALASDESVSGPTLIDVSGGSGTNSEVLEAGYYLIKVSGTYRYGSSAMVADAGYSYRPIGIPSGCDCWLSGFDLPSESNGLMAWINGNAVYWGPQNNDHTYTIIYQHLSEGPVNLAIWDNVYGDNLNNGNFQFEIFPIDFQGITGDDGCVTFEDVPYGGYLLEEENRQSWQNVSGLGGVEVDEEEEIFIIINEDLTQEPAGSICGYKWHDRNENKLRDEEPGLSGWTINLVQFTDCDTGSEWADNVVEYNPGTKQNGTVLTVDRTDSTKALGEAQYSDSDPIEFVSLGFGGSLILGFDNIIVNGAGDDIEIIETSYGNPLCSNYREQVTVYASQLSDGPWVELGSACLDGTFDLGILSWAKYVKLVDISSKNDFSSQADGFDVDGVKALNCALDMSIIDYKITDQSGNYCFEDLALGNYRVQEEMQTGWVNTTPFFQDVNFTDEQPLEVNFGNTYQTTPEEASICGYKFYDEDIDGLFDEGEDGIPRWVIGGYLGGGSPITTITDEDGQYCLSGLNPGTWIVYEEMLPGWLNTAPTSTTVTLTLGQGVSNINFYNYLTYCGDGRIQQPNGQATGGLDNYGYEECDGQEGIMEGYYCSEMCTLELMPQTCENGEQATCNIAELLGQCAQGIQVCQENNAWGECMAVYEPVAEICDGLDNDCDGNVDNGITCGQDNPGGGGGGSGPIGLIIHTESTSSSSDFSAVITWFTNKPATTRVVYDTVSHIPAGTPPNYGYQWSTPTIDTDPKVTFHLVTISGLTAGTTYYFLPISAASPEITGKELSLTFPSNNDDEPLNPEEPAEENEGLVAGVKIVAEEEQEQGGQGQGTPGGAAAGTENGIVAGVEYAEAAESEPVEGLAEKSEAIPEEEDKTNQAATCNVNYIWLLIILNLVVSAIIGLKSKDGNKSVKYSGLAPALITIIAAFVFYPQCWLIYLLLAVLALSLIYLIVLIVRPNVFQAKK